jgi:hypothetical protein
MLYSDVVTAASVGATAGTYDSVGAVTLRADATYVYGFWVEAALATSTAAEAYSGVLKVNSNDLGVGDQTYPCPPFVGGSPATNIGFTVSDAMFIPFFKVCKGKTVINFSYSSNLPDPTGAASVVVGVVYEAGKGSIPSDVLKAWPYMSPIGYGGVTQSKAAITAASATTIGDVTIPGSAKELIGVMQYMIPNLFTAGEEVCGYVEYTSTIPDFSPQKWPFVAAVNAPLGTAVGKGAELQAPVPMCMYFATTGQNETVTAKVTLNVAVTTGHPIVSGLYWR